MANHIKIRTAPGVWVVRAGGAVVAESNKALELVEGDYPPAIYFPRDDIGMAFLEQTESSTRCPHKGQATYFTVTTAGEQLADVAWSYEDPIEAVAAIRDHLSFYTDRVTVEQL